MNKIRYKLIALLCLFTVVFGVVATPKAAQAVPVEETVSVPGAVEIALAKVGEVLKNAALIGIKNALSAFLGKLSYDAAVYIASGGQGQDSLVYDKPVGEYLSDAGDAAAGGFIEGFASDVGFDAAGLCNPGDSFKIDLTIGLETNFGAPQVYKPACTLTELAGNWKDAYSDPKFSDFVSLQFDSTANPLGISMEAEDLTLAAKADAEKAAEKEREDTSGFKPQTEQVSGTITTPASVVEEDLSQSKQNVARYSLQSTDNPVVEALNIFTSTLISKLLKRAQQGLANLSSGSELSGLLGGEFSGTVSGRAAAEAIYAELRQPIFGSGGSFDVLSELAACPDNPELRATNNCAIGSALQTAIQDGWMVQEFIDYQTEVGQSFAIANTELNPVTTQQIQNSEGVNETGITLLKKYRVVPVGWQVASDYIQNGTDTPTLKDLADCYNYCGTADEERSCSFLLTDTDGNTTNYSPYCKLVDPYWVLKAPQNFCEREAPGEVVVEAENFDTDTLTNTQEDLIISRLNYCADPRGCIQEEQEDVCTAYGYCTEEERIYRFDGNICQEEYSSCETFTDDNGDPVSLVKTSLNYNDCATDPGCQWYCQSQNDAGQFDCASPTETYINCSEDLTNNESDYGLSYDVGYDTNEACSCTSTQTCEVPAGSTSGDGDGDGLLDYRECEVNNTDGSQSVCTLSDNCGASNSTYNASTTTCTCTVTVAGDVASAASTVDITVEDSSGADAIQTCTLDDICTSSYSTYSDAPVCAVASAGLLNCGDICYTDETGGTCTNNLGNTCTDGDSFDSDSDAGECVLSDSCSIPTGSYSCTSESGNTCVLGTSAEEPATASDTIYFDNNVEDCESGDAGCKQYVRIKPDTNLIPNALFDYYDTDQNTSNDTTADDLAFCTHDGGGCASADYCDEDSDGTPEGQCIGWIQNGVTAYVLDSNFDSNFVPDIGINFIQLDPVATSGTLDMTVDTGHSLANRTFTFAYRAMAAGTCEEVSFTIGSGDGIDVSSAVTAASDGTDYDYSSDWQDFTTTYTFADTTTDTDITVAIAGSASCNVYIGATTLIEDDEFSNDYTNYAITNVTYLNGDTLSCEPEDVGCELYVEDGASEADGIPGLITNPDSDACVDASGNYNYDNPECNQCNGDPAEDQADDYYVGCDFYQEVALENTIPVTSDPLPTWLTSGTDAYNGTIKRLGGYCEGGSTQHCYEDSECASGSCIDQLSIVPSSGTSCSAAAVGCEEYTNLASVEAGGEGLEYYTSLQQCVRRDDQGTAVFYTFEGSDTAGVQVQDHTLKVDQASTDGAPCTHLDLQSEDFNADCTDSTDYTATEQLEWDCGEEYGTDADCRQYVTAAGDIFYRYESQVIVASDDCTPLRNSTDTRVYFAWPRASDDCSVEEVSCREYKGTDSGSEETIIDEDFSNNSTEDWFGATSTSNESVLQSGYSLQLHDSDTTNATDAEISYELFTTEDTDDDGIADTTYGVLNDGSSYLLTFWAKADDGGTLAASLDYETTTGSNYYFTTAGSSTTADTITLDPNDEDGWQFYTVGPVILPEGTNLDDGDESFKLQYTGTAGTSEAYIDTIVLNESNSQYLIQDTARACNNFEGCRLYEDRDNTSHYLKSFKRLCDDTAVGCEAMLETFNSSNPFTEAYNLDNEYDQDDVIVQYDQPVTLVYDEENECSATVLGCTEFGLPDVDDRTGEIIDYESTYLLDLPDSYSATLCEQPQLSCRTYTSEYDGTVYFKDPGEKLCELKEYTYGSNTFNGWFKIASEAETPDCPLQYDFSDYGEQYASQPLSGVCNSNSAHHDSAGAVLDEKIGALCNQDADCYPADWDESIDGRPRCISNLADDVDLYDGNTHQYIAYTNDGITLSDAVSDFGWAGTCSDDESGCSEYIDPYSPNIEEKNSNWSFEYDVLDDNNVSYASDDTPTGFPDNWLIPYNINSTGADNDGDGDVDEDDSDEIDLDADGVADITASCDTTAAVITAYTGETLAAADGASALKLAADCAIEQGNKLAIAVDKTYNIQASIKMAKDYLDDGDSTISAGEFSVGIHFYRDSDGDNYIDDLMVVDDITLYPVADHATIDYEDGSDATDGLSYWYRFQGQFGLGTSAPIPADGTALAEAAAVFLVNHSSNTIYFDAVSLKEVDKYYYLDYTVDGTTERESFDGTNTCTDQDTDEGAITSDGGCVAFRDTTSDTQNYAQDGLDCTTCLLTPNSDSCRYVVDACDTNTVLKVTKDRVCSEWIACQTANVVENSNGSITSQCFDISRCVELDEDGNCSDYRPAGVSKPSYDKISANTDLHYSTADGNNDELKAIRNLTGFTKVGVTWDDVLYCSGGPNDGVRCTSDANCVNTAISCDAGACSNDTTVSCSDVDDCYGEGDTGTCTIPFSTEGYYPYGWMPEVGESGASTGKDLIEINDFEQLYCAGGAADTSLPCIDNADTSDNPGHCYGQSLKSKVDSDLTGELTYRDFVYVDESGSNIGASFDDSNDVHLAKAFCPNSPNFGTYWPFDGSGGAYAYTINGWQAMPPDGSTSIFVTQYQPYQDCVAPCSNIDLNNVLQVGTGAGTDAFAGGVSYDLQDNISPNGTYALSFDARYVSDFNSVDEAGTSSTVSICLHHAHIGDAAGDDLERKDCFASGFGEADIVFAIDTSGSMGDEIDEVAGAVPDLATQLANAGIDAQFALVDMDDNDDTVVTNTYRGNHIDLDFTDDIDDFTSAVAAMSAENSGVDPTNAIYEVANNSLFDDGNGGTLTFRAAAKKFLVVVTDTGDEIPSNSIDLAAAEDAAVAANLPTFVISSSYWECANDNDGDGEPKCTDWFDNMAEATGGDAYGYDDAKGITYKDWSTNTTIIDDIFENIIDSIDIFQFSTDMETYTMGPITATERVVDTDTGEQALETVTSTLEFLGSDGFAFQIDNISLLPVLEVNQDLSPISRSCRAFPEESSAQCDYIEKSGTQFRGWKGYCVEHDPLNNDRCITWWPMDVLEGETSLTPRDPAGYSGRSAVYHCLLAKGLEHAGFCDEEDWETVANAGSTNDWGQGVICTDDATCDGSPDSCFQGANYVLPDSTSGGIIEHDDLSASYSESLTSTGGQCEVISDSETNCHAWPTSGYCSDSTLVLESDCVAPETWSTDLDILQEADILSRGTCIDIATGVGFEGDHYADYNDNQYSSLTADQYCFYDIDGDSVAEVRSNRSCTSNSDCRIATTAAVSCATLACSSAPVNQDCTYHTDESDSECAETVAAHINTSYETRPLRWVMPDPADNYSYAPGSMEYYERGVIVRLPANEILRNIHASEMEVIEFNPGSAGTGGGAGKEYPFWGQLNGDKDGDLGIYDTGTDLDDRGNIWLTDLLQGAIEFDDNNDVVDKPNSNCYAYKEGVENGFGCRMWGLYDSKFLLENYANLTVSAGHELDLVYQWVWGNFDYNAKNDDLDAACNVSGGDPASDLSRIYNLLQEADINEWFDSDCVESSFGYLAGSYSNNGHERNVWKDLETNHTSLWNSFYVDYDTGATDGSDIIPFNGDDVSGLMWPSDDESDGNLTINDHDGGNILSLYVDFNKAGYIQAVYAMIYFAARGTTDTPLWYADAIVETTFENMMHLDIQPRESCALISSSVGATGDNFAWANRSNEDDYQISFGEDKAYSLGEYNKPYGSIGTQEETPLEWDYLVANMSEWATEDITTTWSSLGQQPVVALQSNAITQSAGRPLSCLGECDNTACVLDPNVLGTDNCDDSSCGSTGVCMGVGDAAITAEGQVSGYANLTDQIEGTVANARNRLKHVFANIDTFYQLDFADTAYNNNTPDYWDDGSGNIFDNMDQCANNERPDDWGDDSEYCGVLPTLTSLTINGESGGNSSYSKVSNGQTVTLQFDSNVDGEQEPLDKIHIDWGDGSEPTTENWEAKPTTHTYTHAYSCGSENGNRFFGTYCDFKPKITLVDNWNWCSGQYAGYCSNSSYATEEDCTDHTATEGTTWTDGGDHRYTEESTDIMVSCQSYDEPSLAIRVDAKN